MTIAMLGFLKEYKNVTGPHLIMAPKSTLGNWYKEFKRWFPSCNVILMQGRVEHRTPILNDIVKKKNKFDVLLTSYVGANLARSVLKKLKWHFVVIDEAHRIKNDQSYFSQNVRMF